jgi:hypothetical protein
MLLVRKLRARELVVASAIFMKSAGRIQSTSRRHSLAACLAKRGGCEGVVEIDLFYEVQESTNEQGEWRASHPAE